MCHSHGNPTSYNLPRHRKIDSTNSLGLMNSMLISIWQITYFNNSKTEKKWFRDPLRKNFTHHKFAISYSKQFNYCTTESLILNDCGAVLSTCHGSYAGKVTIISNFYSMWPKTWKYYVLTNLNLSDWVL